MAHYEPDKIIQLLQLCAWRQRTEMTQNGLIELASRLGPALPGEEAAGKRTKAQEPNDRYFVDLLSDARKRLKDGSTFNKRESYIQLLLNHAGFNYWDDWKEALRKPGMFLLSEKADLEIAGEKSLTMMIPQVLEKKLSPTVSFVKKSSPIELLSSREESLVALANQALEQLEKSPVIICALPLSWKDQASNMRHPAWGEFSGTGRILPVWIDVNDEWNPVAPHIPSLKQDQSIAGISGLLTGLLFLQSAGIQPEDSGANAEKQSRENAPQFNHSTVGFYMQGGTVHHLSTGGNQTINNYFD